MEQKGNYTLTSDEKGNAYLYGTFENNSEVTVKYTLIPQHYNLTLFISS